MATDLHVHPEFLRHEMGPYHLECPDRLRAIEGQLVASRIENLFISCGASPATETQLCHIYRAEYVRELVASVPIAGYIPIDPDTSMNSHTYMTAVPVAGAAMDATNKVIAGELENAFYSVRPPGHHVEPGRATGLYPSNSVAVAACHTLEHHSLQHVAVVDLDVHYGNGTEAVFRDEPRVLMRNIFQHLFYPYSGTETVAANIVNIPLPVHTNGPTTREVVETIWLPRLEMFEPKMLFISAGFSTYREDDLGQMGLIETDYARITKQPMQVACKHAKGWIVSCLEGGYNLSALDRSVVTHVKALVELQAINDDGSLMSLEKVIEIS